MNDVSRLEVSASRDDRIADRTAPDAPALLINLRAAFRVNRTVGARAFVEPPVRRCDNRLGVLFGDVSGDKPQCRLSDSRLRGHAQYKQGRVRRTSPAPRPR